MSLSREYYVLIMIIYNWNMFMTLILTDIVRLFLTLIKKYIVLKQWIIYLHLRSCYFYLGKHFNFHEFFNFNDLILCSIFTLLKTNAEQ